MAQKGASQTEIARELGTHKSTISRELRRNRGKRGWHPHQANLISQGRKLQNQNAYRISSQVWFWVEKLLAQSLSPEQISARLCQEKKIRISPESIYCHIYSDKRAGGHLHLFLRCQKQRRKRYASGQDRRGGLKNRINIEQRPTIVATKERLGDWEGDTVIGKNHKGALVTLAERKSRYTVAKMLSTREAEPVATAISELLKAHKDKVHTITFDNGKEFAKHEAIAKKLEANVYFAHPYSSWERGLNENTNGLLRQYFPKGTDFAKVSATAVSKALEQLNHRPRKVLGFKSPYEVFFNKKMCYV
jgi:IS30 family transposase